MKSFLQGKKSLAIAALRPPANPAPAFPGPCTAAGVAPPGTRSMVEVVKEGDKVVRLVVTCTCGERVEIECLYPAGG